MNAVSAVGAVALVPWLLIGWTTRSNAALTVSSIDENTGHGLPDGLPTGYGAVLRGLQDVLALPQDSVLLRGSVYEPGLVLGVVLLWLVPVVLACRARGNPLASAVRRDVRRVLALSAAGAALCLVLFGLHVLVSRSVYMPTPKTGRSPRGDPPW